MTLSFYRRLWLGFMLLAAAGPVAAANIGLDVFAIPSKPIVALVAKTSDNLKHHGMQSFYAKGLPVHVTLYLTSFPEGSEAAIKQAVEAIAARQQPFSVRANGFTVSAGNWAFIDVERSPQLQRLADEVTMAVSPLRNPHPTLPGWVKAYPNKRAAFERYGSPNVFQSFEPHLTLLAAEQNPALKQVQQALAAKPPMAQGRIIGMGIGITDQFGQQKKVLATYYFSTKQQGTQP